MKKQNQVILSLGSNLGNRRQTMELTISAIHESVGTVTKVSALYETPSWGFESDFFYNCALIVNTHKTAQRVLEEVLALEKSFGRTRSEKSGYQARTIDIDVIAFNEEIIQTDQLQVPHPQMQNRLFVLVPMRDLNLDWRHPILQKYLPELVQLSQDSSSCKLVDNLEVPISKFNFSSFNYIVIEGNIGVGKTTLASKIAEDFNAKLVLERFADNPFLPKFYEDQSRYAFPLEMSFLADRYQQLSDDLAQFDLFKDFIVADYHLLKSLIFSKVTLQEDEFRLYKMMFDIIHKETPKPDLYVYLYQNTSQLLENIKKRGRSYELEIQEKYLDSINQGYLDYIKTKTDLNVLVIDVTGKDFVENQLDYLAILNEIHAKISLAD